jgi:ubiquinol oxidase
MSTTFLPVDQLSTADHHAPSGLGDRFAFALCKLLRFSADMMFRKRYIHRAVVLETVAAVPGMVAAMLQHLRSLRVMRGRADMVRTLLDEAENERMHLMAFVELAQPSVVERLMILVAQIAFFNAFFFLYLVAPRVAHRLVGYFEEEAVISYTRFADEIRSGHIPNLDIPEFAREYWRLDPQARLLELVHAVRADEMHHRDVNHGYALVLAHV